MRFYECMFIVHPSVPEEEINQISEVVCDTIKAHDGEILKVDKWGKRKLAYEVKKERYGYYVLIYFKYLQTGLRELDRRLKLHEKIIRHLIVRTEEKSLDQLKSAPVTESETAIDRTGETETKVSAPPDSSDDNGSDVSTESSDITEKTDD